MSTLTIESTPRLDFSPEFKQLLDDIDERVASVELSVRYASTLSADEWVALHDTCRRNGAPLVTETVERSFIGFAA